MNSWPDGSRLERTTFDGVRWNDLHYTRAAKQAARAAMKKEAPHV